MRCADAILPRIHNVSPRDSLFQTPKLRIQARQTQDPECPHPADKARRVWPVVQLTNNPSGQKRKKNVYSPPENPG